MLQSLFGSTKSDPFGGYDREIIKQSFLGTLIDYNNTYGSEKVYDVIYFLKALKGDDIILFNKIYLTWINEHITNLVERIEVEFKVKLKITPNKLYASLGSFNTTLKKINTDLDPKFKNLQYYADHSSIYLTFQSIDNIFHKSLIISENELTPAEYVGVMSIIAANKNYSVEKFNKDYEKYYKFYNFLVHKYALKNYDKFIKDEIFGFYCYENVIISILDELTDDQRSNLSELCSITPKKISDTKINESKIKQNIEIFKYNNDFFNNLYNDNKQKIDELFGIITVKIIIYI